MNKEAKVQVQKMPSKSSQFGRSGQYGAKMVSPKVATGLSILALVLAIVSFVTFKKAPQKVERKSAEISIDIEDLSEKNTSLSEGHLPSLVEKVFPKQKKVVKKVVFYTGPQKMRRPNSGKIPPGSMVKAQLLTGASSGLVRAKTLQALEVAGEEFVPSGSILLGQGRSAEHRLYIQFGQLVFPDGGYITIQAQAADKSDKIVGLRGSKVGAYASRLAGAVALNFASGYSEGLKQKEVQQGVVVDKASSKNALLNGASAAALELSQQEFQKLKNQPPLIEVEEGMEFYVIFGVQ